MDKFNEALIKERDAMDLGFEKYRGSGLTLSATLITLSSGIFYLAFSEWKTVVPVIGYVICIVFVILQHVAIFRGGMNQARSQYHWYNAVAEYARNENQKVLQDGARKRGELLTTANFFFGKADIFCELSVIAFVVQSLFLLTRLSSWRVAVVVGMVILFAPKAAVWGDWFISRLNRTERIRKLIKKLFVVEG